MTKPTFKSERQIQIDILNTILAETNLTDVNAGSILDILTQAIAQEDFNQVVQLANILKLLDLKQLSGTDLENKAFEYGLTRTQARQATGLIDILRDSSFVKVSTTLYAGLPAPLIGDVTINVNDASNLLYGTSGTLIIGRGTSNEEEATYSVAPVDNTNYFTFTLDNTLTNNHSNDETVILKQGVDEDIIAGTVIRIEATSNNPEIRFTTTEDSVLLAGESSIENVNVICTEAGEIGNIPIKAISGEGAFVTPPFAGARAENNTKFTTGTNRQSDDSLKDDIRSHIQSLTKAVESALITGLTGLVDPTTAKRIISTNLIRPVGNDPVKIYIDDGTGYEPTFKSIGFENVLINSTGGDVRLQLDLFPLVKAQLETNSLENYDFSTTGLTLIYTVENQSETITFNNSDFKFPANATAEEVVTAINNKTTLLEARTSNSGKGVVIQSSMDTNEILQVVGGTANAILNFPTDPVETLYLYKDDKKLYKDGVTALLETQNNGPFNFDAIGAFPHDLDVVVDNKTGNPLTITFEAADFIDTAACTVAEIITVINAQLPGATAQANAANTKVQLYSNTKLTSKSYLQVLGGTANDATNGLNFSTTLVQGKDNDYIINKELGIVQLNTPLTKNSSITAGNKYSRAYLRAALPELYSPTAGTTLDISVDGGATQTITFDGTFSGGVNAQNTANFINNTLEGAKAISRKIGSLNYLEIATNTYDPTNASIEILSSSTANAVFDFTLDEVQSNQIPHKAYVVSQNSEPFVFLPADSLVTTVDENLDSGIFTILMEYKGTVTSGTNTSTFANVNWNTIFVQDSELQDYYIAFNTGNNSTTGTVETVTNQGGNTWRYSFDALPGTLANIAVNDFVSFTGFTNTGNNGFFLITAVNTTGNGYIEITNVNGVAATGESGTALMSQRRRITSYTAATGAITVNAPFSNTPIAGEQFTILPSTINNLIRYFNNLRITSLSNKAIIEGVEQNTKLQISSKQEGSDGIIQITGGPANTKFNFSTTKYKGLQAYNQYTGLIELANKTIYGDDTDYIAFPGIGAAGIRFEILSPLVQEIVLNLNVLLAEGLSLINLENTIKSVVIGYVNNLKIGEDVILERIRSAVIQINGIIDVEITNLTENIPIAAKNLARTRSSLITIG